MKANINLELMAENFGIDLARVFTKKTNAEIYCLKGKQEDVEKFEEALYEKGQKYTHYRFTRMDVKDSENCVYIGRIINEED